MYGGNTNRAAAIHTSDREVMTNAAAKVFDAIVQTMDFNLNFT